jgi:hypothetical protein
MYTATVLLEIEEFIPMTGSFTESPSIIAKIYPPTDTSPPPPAEPPVFSGDGQTITITIPKGYQGSVQLTYQLPDSKYVLLGAAFKGPDGGVGRLEFRDVIVDRDPYGSQMTVTDACMHTADSVTFAYVILVQEVSTANIGLIDPEIETENQQE